MTKLSSYLSLPTVERSEYARTHNSNFCRSFSTFLNLSCCCPFTITRNMQILHDRSSVEQSYSWPIIRLSSAASANIGYYIHIVLYGGPMFTFFFFFVQQLCVSRTHILVPWFLHVQAFKRNFQCTKHTPSVTNWKRSLLFNIVFIMLLFSISLIPFSSSL